MSRSGVLELNMLIGLCYISFVINRFITALIPTKILEETSLLDQKKFLLKYSVNTQV